MRSSALPWVVLAFACIGAGAVRGHFSSTHEPSRPPWQHNFVELNGPQQRFYRSIREGLFDLERFRATGAWASPQSLSSEAVPPFDETACSLRQQGIYVNYLCEFGELRWLILYIEPDRPSVNERAPADEEHHPLADGTMLHVTVWTQPTSAPAPTGVLAFPVSDGWVQQVGR